MNREQRRLKANPPALQKQPAGPPLAQQTLSISYGHNGQMVVVALTHKVDNLVLSEPQVDGMIEGLKLAKSKLNKHKATAARLQGHGNA